MNMIEYDIKISTVSQNVTSSSLGTLLLIVWTRRKMESNKKGDGINRQASLNLIDQGHKEQLYRIVKPGACSMYLVMVS